MPEKLEDTLDVDLGDIDRMNALKPHFRYLLREVREVLPARDDGHLRVILHRYRHQLSKPEYVYDERMRRYRTLSLADIEVLRSAYKPRLRSFLNIVHTWAE